MVNKGLAKSTTHSSGFTIVELIVVIVIIAILATITIVAYTGIQQRASVAAMSSNLKNIVNIFEIYKIENGNYPTDISSTVAKSNSNIILQSANANANNFCVNAYHKTNPSLLMSWSSNSGLQNGLCDGATIGNSIGGAVPTASRGINVMSDLSRWTLSEGATYDATLKELYLGVNGLATSPLIRIDKPVGIRTGGDFFASTSSPYSAFAPNGGYHSGISYYASDGVTLVMNSANYTSNGCAHGSGALNTWDLSDMFCSYSGGPLVVYTRIRFSGSSGGYTSPDLKIRNPLLIVND